MAPTTGSTYDVTNSDSHLSFPSGHTAVATSLGVSLAMTATLEHSQAAPYLWGAAGHGVSRDGHAADGRGEVFACRVGALCYDRGESRANRAALRKR